MFILNAGLEILQGSRACNHRISQANQRILEATEAHARGEIDDEALKNAIAFYKFSHDLAFVAKGILLESFKKTLEHAKQWVSTIRAGV